MQHSAAHENAQQFANEAEWSRRSTRTPLCGSEKLLKNKHCNFVRQNQSRFGEQSTEASWTLQILAAAHFGGTVVTLERAVIDLHAAGLHRKQTTKRIC